MNDNNNLNFKFSYLALKLLGKNLYSNAWSALSELVANGLDAGAKNIYVYINTSDKSNSIIEIYDDGSGMTLENLSNNYVQIGRNRRAEQDDSETVMGRKGIGKLAALFLSRHYFVSTKTSTTDLVTYEMNFTEEKENSNSENPSMQAVSTFNPVNRKFLDFEHGTMVRMENVNLRRYGTSAIDSLNNILADFFSIESISDQMIYVKVVSDVNSIDKPFSPVIKQVPYKNMVSIICFDSSTYDRLKYLKNTNIFKLPLKNSEFYYEGTTAVIKEFQNDDEFKFFTSSENKKYGHLKGWIGIHSTIKNNVGVINDPNFKRNNLYNPLKLRVYVRNKLAIDNFLPIINNTQAFVNYIEGEINFDILDDNEFPDIATTNRQSMDENDRRIISLSNKIRNVVGKLISDRHRVSNEMISREKVIEEKTTSTAKTIFREQLTETTKKVKEQNETFKNVPDKYDEEIGSRIMQNLKGTEIKSDYSIFFSHSSKDKKILDFYFYLLRHQGVREDEMFYTSKDTSTQIQIREKLNEMVRRSITNTNTFVFFYTTENFKDSEYCMFEGGAAWATRTPEDVTIVFDSMDHVPRNLNPNGQFCLELDTNTDIMIGSVYTRVIQTLNILIRHINKGRLIKNEALVQEFSEGTFPDKVGASQGEKPIVDETVIKYWQEYAISAHEQENSIIK